MQTTDLSTKPLISFGSTIVYPDFEADKRFCDQFEWLSGKGVAGLGIETTVFIKNNTIHPTRTVCGLVKGQITSIQRTGDLVWVDYSCAGALSRRVLIAVDLADTVFAIAHDEAALVALIAELPGAAVIPVQPG